MLQGCLMLVNTHVVVRERQAIKGSKAYKIQTNEHFNYETFAFFTQSKPNQWYILGYL